MYKVSAENCAANHKKNIINVQSRIFEKIFDSTRPTPVETATHQPHSDNKINLDFGSSNGLKPDAQEYLKGFP